MITFRGVLSEDVDVWWPAVSGWIAAALGHGPGFYAPDDVLASIRAQEMQLWVTCDDEEPIGCVVTAIERFPRKAVLVIGPIGGVERRVVEWIKGMDALLLKFAKAEGCDVQLSEGRRGWDRFVGNGWRTVTTQYLREIER